jgi:glycerate kinase
MKIIIAMDSFKGSLGSKDAGNAVASGIESTKQNHECIVFPMADGGEGTTEALTACMNGEMHLVTVSDPLGRPMQAGFGYLPESRTAIMEMASCAGLPLLKEKERNPLYTTTYGVGEMIKAAIKMGARHFIMGIGGSATNDGGVGMLEALGYSFQDADGNPIRRGAIGLKDLARIDTTYVLPILSDCDFRVACDVSNPLCGKRGASFVFGPQKGADDMSIHEMDGWLSHYAELAKELDDHVNPEMPGAGAAGGLGFAFQAFLQSKLESGIKIVLEATKFEEAIKDADLIITGEGCLDGQTARGKVPYGIAKVAKAYNIPVVAIAGSIKGDGEGCHEYGIDAFFPILPKPMSLKDAMNPEKAKIHLATTAAEVIRALTLFQKK